MLDKKGCVKKTPTFEQFLQFLVGHPNPFNPHWLPYYKNCAPCVLTYDAIVKKESGASDQEYVMAKSRLRDFTQFKYRHETHGGGTEESIKTYFKDINCSLIEKLYHLYELDFELFEYELHPFDEICKQ